MTVLGRPLTLAFLGVALAACTVPTSEPAGSSQTEAVAAAAPDGADGGLENVERRVARCLAPVAPMTGEWSCGSSGVRTGEHTATVSADYAGNCTGQATVAFSIPSCGVAASPPQHDEIFITAASVATASEAACVASYLDYSITALSAATTTWTVSQSGRAYGVYANGYCQLHAPPYYPASDDFTQFQISADAYASSDTSATVGPAAVASLTPVEVSFDASFE